VVHLAEHELIWGDLDELEFQESQVKGRKAQRKTRSG
jgi:hypothetical protein